MYKKKFCKFYPDKLDKCEYSCFCPCAHSEEDLMLELLTNFERDEDFFLFLYKTSCCPYMFLAAHEPNKGCPYAHCLIEWRRKI